MDVTEQINRQMILTGGGSARPEYYSVNRTLNYAQDSNSLTKARTERVSVIPASLNYKDTVGLFGAENIFIKIQLDIVNTVTRFEGGIISNNYEDAVILKVPDNSFGWDEAVVDDNADLVTVNTYEPALFDNSLSFIPGAVVRVDLDNLKTGNKYIDAWFDVSLYTADREEWPYDRMYLGLNDSFYIGFHARNTKRLPYNVSMVVGREYLVSSYELPPEERRYLVRGAS